MAEAIVALIVIGLVLLICIWPFRPEPGRPPSRAPRQPQTTPQHQPAVVQRIIDGDTVTVRIDRQTVTLRLDGIDCPENGQRWGNVAKAGLIKLIGGKHIRVEGRCIDQYGRTVATIYVWWEDRSEWMNVNTRMVVLGHAWVSGLTCQGLPKHRRDELFRVQRWAKSKRVGLWRDDNPLPPWKHRNGTS